MTSKTKSKRDSRNRSSSETRSAVIRLAEKTGSFAEDKDIALQVRTHDLIPALRMKKKVVLNFDGVTLSTQSFMHALLSELIRNQGADVLDYIAFKNCNPIVRSLIRTVVEYSQETDEHRR